MPKSKSKAKSKCEQLNPILWNQLKGILNSKQKRSLQDLILADKEYHDGINYTTKHPIDSAFIWEATKEGFEFWYAIDRLANPITTKKV